MNGVSDQDIERLDELLDGALPPADADQLRARLAREPELAATLAELEVERETRTAVWASLEPDEASARTFARRVTATARRQESWGHVRRYARFGSAAAACMLVGYLVGWAGQADGPDRRGAGGPVMNEVAGGGGNGDGRSGAANVAGRYRVPVGYDDRGRPITQDFDTLEEAQRFAEEFRRWRELREADSSVTQEQL